MNQTFISQYCQSCSLGFWIGVWLLSLLLKCLPVRAVISLLFPIFHCLQTDTVSSSDEGSKCGGNNRPSVKKAPAMMLQMLLPSTAVLVVYGHCTQRQ